MKLIFFTGVGMVLWVLVTVSSELNIPYSKIDAPVVHAGRYHILSCKDNYVVLDGARGMSLYMIGHRSLPE